MATISSPMGRTPRSGGAGPNTYKKGGTTKVAGVMKKGGSKPKMTMKKGEMMKYQAGGKKKEPLPKNALELWNELKAINAAKSPAEQDEMYFKAKREQEKQEAIARAVKSQFRQNKRDDFKYNTYWADVHDAIHFNEPGTYNKYYNDKLIKAAEETKKAYEQGKRKKGGTIKVAGVMKKVVLSINLQVQLNQQLNQLVVL